jgi:predicted small secreted protein
MIGNTEPGSAVLGLRGAGKSVFQRALKEIPMRKLIAILFFAAPLVAACNTVEGFGQDLERAGNHVERRAEEAK